MINLEQIRILEQKVNNAVSVIARLKEENKTLRDTLEKSQKKMIELENLLHTFRNDQDEIESGILEILDKLDRLEDETLEPALPEKEASQKKSPVEKTVEKTPDNTLHKTPPKEKSTTPKKVEKTIILEESDEEDDEDIEIMPDKSGVDIMPDDENGSSGQSQEELDIF